MEARLLEQAGSVRSSSQGDVSESAHSLTDQIAMAKFLRSNRKLNPARLLLKNRVRLTKAEP